MPDSEKKRIKPVIEEVVETPVEEKIVEIEPQPIASEAPQTENESISESAIPKEDDVNRKMNLKLIVIITVVSALVAAVVSGGVYAYLSGVESRGDEGENAEPMATATASPTPAASSIPEPKVDVSTLSVQVLNGSGAIGAAGGAQDVLEAAGFEIKNTGNAKSYNFAKTVIQIKSGVPATVASMAKKALEEGDYAVEIGEVLSASSPYDIVVTVGKD